MIGILLVGHGKYATGLKENVRTIIGDVKKCYAIDFINEDSPEELDMKIKSAIKELNDEDGVIIFLDLLNGTPFNTCAKYAIDNKKIKLVYGANAPMILDTIMKIQYSNDDLEEAVKNAIEVGKEQIGLFKAVSLPVEDDL